MEFRDLDTADPEEVRFYRYVHMMAKSQAKFHEYVASVTEICLPKCVLTPGHFLTEADRVCLENCADRFMDSSRDLRIRYLAGIETKTLDGKDSPHHRQFLDQIPLKTEQMRSFHQDQEE